MTKRYLPFLLTVVGTSGSLDIRKITFALLSLRYILPMLNARWVNHYDLNSWIRIIYIVLRMFVKRIL